MALHFSSSVRRMRQSQGLVAVSFCADVAKQRCVRVGVPTDKRIEQAEQMFLQGKKLSTIAKELDIPEGTVRRWKCVHHWGDADLSTPNVSSFKAEAKRLRKNKRVNDAKEIEADRKQLDQMTQLTERQKQFCMLYVRCFNATRAYYKVYGCALSSAAIDGCKLMKRPEIRAAIDELKQNKLNRMLLTEEDIFQKYIDIAFADVTDYMDFGQGKAPVISGDGIVTTTDEKTGKKKPLMQEVNTLTLHDSAQVDGTLIAEVRHGRDGVDIKLADKLKALDWLSAHMGMATDEQRARIDQLRAHADYLRQGQGAAGAEPVTIVDDIPKGGTDDAGKAD